MLYKVKHHLILYSFRTSTLLVFNIFSFEGHCAITSVWVGGATSNSWHNSLHWVDQHGFLLNSVPNSTDYVCLSRNGSQCNYDVPIQQTCVVQSGFTAECARMTISGDIIFSIYGSLDVYGDFSLSDAGTFNANTGSVRFKGSAGPYYINNTSSNSLVFYNISNYSNITLNCNITVLGNLDNYGSINANGYTITIAGNFNNNGTFFPGSGTVLFNGVNQQTIGGTSSTTFNNLHLDNANGAKINRNTYISNTLTLVNGELNLNSFMLSVTNSCACAISRINGYIKSETNLASNPSIVQWNMGTTIGDHTFPFGVSNAADGYIPFTFNKITSGNATISVSTRATGSNNIPWTTGVTNMNRFVNDSSVTSVIDRWWEISTVGSVTGNLIFTYRGIENTLPVYYATGTLAAQHWNGTIWETPVGSGTGLVSGTGTVTVNGVSNFSPWILVAQPAPLPVELLSFKAKEIGKAVQINWTTASETNNDFFILERTQDGKSFEILEIVNGSGNSKLPLNYQVIDEQPYNGINYYRLKQKDIDGKLYYSDLISVKSLKENNCQLLVYPNPFCGETLYWELDGTDETEILVTISDPQGRIFYCKNEIETKQHIQMIHPLSRGVYFITALAGGRLHKAKIIAY